MPAECGYNLQISLLKTRTAPLRSWIDDITCAVEWHGKILIKLARNDCDKMIANLHQATRFHISFLVKFENEISKAITPCFYAVKPRVLYSTGVRSYHSKKLCSL